MNSVTPSYLLSNRPLRAYEGIWRKLRYTQKCVISVTDVVFVARIKRMISKEKCMDKGFAVLNDSVEVPFLKFTWDGKSKELTIELITRYGLVDIKG